MKTSRVNSVEILDTNYLLAYEGVECFCAIVQIYRLLEQFMKERLMYSSGRLDTLTRLNTVDPLKISLSKNRFLPIELFYIVKRLIGGTNKIIKF